MICETANGTKYLTEPEVAIIAQTVFSPLNISDFINGVGYPGYLDDSWTTDASLLCKFAGQLCYMSFSGKYTKNADIGKYIRNIISQGHGSVLEHASYSILAYGVSRALTHELVRHRAGFAFSQVSQRYCGPDIVRFVKRPEIVTKEDIEEFESFIDDVYSRYKKHAVVVGDRHTRKLANQAARAYLPNCTEAPIVVTANVRAWRHFIEARGTEHADIEIRNFAIKLLEVLQQSNPVLFSGYRVVTENGVSQIVSDLRYKA